jgi:hypothetical protein
MSHFWGACRVEKATFFFYANCRKNKDWISWISLARSGKFSDQGVGFFQVGLTNDKKG